MTYSQKLYWRAKIKLWGILLILISIFVADYIYGISQISYTVKTFELLLASFLGFCFYPLLIASEKKLNVVEDKLMDDADHAQLGFEGENKVREWLGQIVPGEQYFIFPNVKLPGHRFDIDFIIIGPKGVIVLEVKNLTDKVEFSDDEYFQVKNGQRNILSPGLDPREETRRHVYYLRQYFEEKGSKNIRILKAVVFIDPSRTNIEGSTGIYIASGFDSLKRFFDSIEADPVYTPEYCKKLKSILTEENDK